MDAGDDPIELPRDLEAELLAGADAFDREYFRRFGRFPAESSLSEASLRHERRRAAIESLAERGATEGERAAARAALGRLFAEDVIGDFPAAAFEQDDPDEED